MSSHKLTNEGRQYLKNGLPEINLVKVIKNSISLNEAEKRIDNFKIALQWAKKNNWVKLEDGKIILLKRVNKSPLGELLKKIDKNELVSSRDLEILLKRKLVEKETETKRNASKLVGKEVTNLTPELIKTGLWKSVKLKPYNVKATGKVIYPGKRQPYNQFLKLAREKIVEMGFIEMTSPTIELEFWNFDALYQPQDHPSRDWSETYSLKTPQSGRLPGGKTVAQVKATHENGWTTGSTGWGYKWDPKKAAKLMPRAHSTAASSRLLANKPKIPGKYFAVTRCYRPDVIDATHGVEFNQFDGIVLGEELTFRELLGLLKQFAFEIAGATAVKFYSDYYPFTEPSVQLSAKHPELGWVEFGGAGIFREELTKPLGINVPVLAWGIGIDRLAMHKLQIKDIRHMFSQDLKWIRKKEAITTF